MDEPAGVSLIGPAVAATVAALSPTLADAALVRLIERYAAALDEAEELAAEAREVEPDDEGSARLLRALLQRVDSHAVLAEIGPKLAAALESLGASPKARAGFVRKGVSQNDDAAKSKLDELRERKRVRQGRTAPVDTTAS